MNLKRWDGIPVSEKHQRIALACGWREVRLERNVLWGFTPDRRHPSFEKFAIVVPDYIKSLDAIHKALISYFKKQTLLQKNMNMIESYYVEKLKDISETRKNLLGCFEAEASDKAFALIRTMARFGQ